MRNMWGNSYCHRKGTEIHDSKSWMRLFALLGKSMNPIILLLILSKE